MGPSCLIESPCKVQALGKRGVMASSWTKNTANGRCALLCDTSAYIS